MIKLYSYYRSINCYSVRIALNYKGLEYEYNPVHLVKNGGEQHTPEFKALNPQEQLPALVDENITLTQSFAIMEYLEEKYPSPRMMPEDVELRAYTRQLALICAMDIHPMNSLRVLNYVAAELALTQEKKTNWKQKWLKDGFDAIETLLGRAALCSGENYCCGDQITIADMCLIPQVHNARRYDMDIEQWPLIAAIEKNCLKLEAFIKAYPEHQPDTPEGPKPAFLKQHNLDYPNA